MANKTVTVRPSGGTYTTLQAAITGEVAANANLVTGLDGILTISIEGTWSSADTTRATVAGFTVDASHYVNIVTDAANRAGVTRSASKYRLVAGSTSGGILTIQCPFTRVTGIQVSDTTGDGLAGVLVESSDCILDSILAYDCRWNGLQSGSSSARVCIRNCFVVGSSAYGITFGSDTPVTDYCYNNVSLANGGVGISAGNNVSLINTNNYSGGNTGADYGVGGSGSFTTTTCASQDGTAGATVVYTTATFTNVTAGSENITLANGSGLYDTGTNLSAASVYPFNWDIIGTTRAAWNIGAFEAATASGVTAAVAVTQAKQTLSITASSSTVRTNDVQIVQKKQAVSITVSVANSASASVGIIQKKQAISIMMRHYSESRTIDYTNYDPATRSNAEIAAAAALDIFFAHASTGGYIVGGNDWPQNGMAALQAENARYTIGRQTWETPTAPDPAWYTSNDGLGDYYFGNPGYVAKIADFRARLAANSRALANALDVAMFKFCWIDSPDPSGWGNGYSAATMFAAYRDGMLAEEALSPGLILPWWTLPIEITGYQGVHDCNVMIREYTATNNKWLFDIASIECHDDSGVLHVDENGYELLCAEYSNDAWGHPNAAGALKLAKGFWSLFAAITSESTIRTATVGIVQKKQAVSITAISASGRTASVGIVQKKQAVSITASSNNSRTASLAIAQKKQAIAIQVNSTGFVHANISLNQKRQAIAIIGTSENSVEASIAIEQRAQAVSINVYTVPHVSALVGISQAAQAISIQAESNNDRAAVVEISQKQQAVSITAESNSNSTVSVSIQQKRQGIYIKISEKKIYQPGEIITTGTADIKLYAQWRPL